MFLIRLGPLSRPHVSVVRIVACKDLEPSNVRVLPILVIFTDLNLDHHCLQHISSYTVIQVRPQGV